MRTIPFHPKMRKALREGRKNATTRTEPYGRVGDKLYVVDASGVAHGAIELVRVQKSTLQHVADDHFREEGFDSSSEFVEMWARIHPTHGFQGGRLVWFHVFRVIEMEEGGA